MKAKLFLLGLCVLALASCSIDETTSVNDSNAISFKATATRATAATTNTIDAFTVWAWEKVDESTTEFMDGVQAARASEGSGTYATSHTYYWPGAPLDFYAFIPAATVETDDSTGEENVYFGGKVTPSAEVIEGADDTYEFPTYVATATITDPSNISIDVFVPTVAEEGIDLGYAATLGQSTGTVSLNFRHALSQVAFKVMNGNADWTVDIQGVTLCGIYKEGTYTLPEFGEAGTTAHNATDATKGEWKVGEVQGRFNAGIAATTLEGASSESQSITAENGALMLIPQTVAEWDPLTDPTNTALGAYVRINCQVTDGATGEQIWPNYHELDENKDRLDYAEITVPFDVKWEEGNLYTYTIVFGEGLGYYAPDDENTDLDGQPVLIPIRFTVDIDDFGNVDEAEVSTETEELEPLILEYHVISTDHTIELPVTDVTYVEIDWGDGETETTSSDNPSHTYSETGTYTVSVTGTAGGLCGAYYSDDTDKYTARDGWNSLSAIIQWGNMKLTSMDYAFYGCDYLKSLPDGSGPFENVTSFDYAFYDCIELGEVHGDMFKNCTKATSFKYVFGHCYSLESVPEDLFKDCTGSTNFRGAFATCRSLVTAPTFKGLSKVEDFYELFDSCSSLTTVPVDIFSGCTAVTNFNWTFNGCSNVSGESPYDEITVGSETVKVHLYQRENYPDIYATPTSYSRCFQRSTFSDIDDIPSSWSGNGD